MDGRPRHLAVLCLGLTALASGPAAQGLPQEVYLFAKVRDFKEANPTDNADTHPHFNTYNGCSAMEAAAATVEDNLSVSHSADGGVFAGDNRGPMLRADMPSTLAKCFQPFDRFSDWFQDKSPDINRAFQVQLPFKLDPATGLYVHTSAQFFPLDNGKPFNKFAPTDPDPFGHLQTGTVDGHDLSVHNYGFTMEFHTRIVYEAGKSHQLSFQGDDDIWVFLNGRKIVDLGGVHKTQVANVNLDSLASSLGLEDGKDYPMDFYFAERHTASSSFKITANLHQSSVGIKSFAGRSAGKGALAKLSAGSKVDVYDRGGRLVRSLRAGSDLAPDRVWDGKDASGRPTAPGMYFYRAQGPSASPVTGWVVNSGVRHD